MNPLRFRVTIEGPAGAGKTKLTSLVAAQLQVLGCKAVHIILADEAPPRSPVVKADAQIIVKQLPC